MICTDFASRSLYIIILRRRNLMKKSLKKSVSILLSLIMVFSVFAIVPITANAENPFDGGAGISAGDIGEIIVESATPTAFVKVTDVNQITEENIGTCSADEAVAWILANWDTIMNTDAYIVDVVFFDGIDQYPYYYLITTDTTKSDFEDDPGVLTDSISGLQFNYEDGDDVYICSKVASDPELAVSFTKVTDVDQITEENIGACYADEAIEWILANWDTITNTEAGVVDVVFFDGIHELPFVYLIDNHISKSEFEADPYGESVPISELQNNYQIYDDDVYICSKAASDSETYTVTWDSSNLSSLNVNNSSQTIDGITLKSNADGIAAFWIGDRIQYDIGYYTGGYTFTNTLGVKFKKIEITAAGYSDAWECAAEDGNLGSGWSWSSGQATWNGNAASVDLLTSAEGFMGQASSIVFTLEVPAPTYTMTCTDALVDAFDVRVTPQFFDVGEDNWDVCAEKGVAYTILSEPNDNTFAVAFGVKVPKGTSFNASDITITMGDTALTLGAFDSDKDVEVGLTNYSDFDMYTYYIRKGKLTGDLVVDYAPEVPVDDGFILLPTSAEGLEVGDYYFDVDAYLRYLLGDEYAAIAADPDSYDMYYNYVTNNIEQDELAYNPETQTFRTIRSETTYNYYPPEDDGYMVYSSALKQVEPEPVFYTVTWKNDDGSVIDTTEVEEGVVPTHADATKANDTFYSYTFAGWNDGENTYAPSELPAVTGDVTYSATFTAVPFSEVTVTTKADFETAIDNNSVDTIIIGADIASGYAGSGNIVSYRKNVNRTLTIKCVGSEKYSLKGYAFRVGSDTSKAASLSFENVIIDGNCPNAISANDYDFFMTVVGANSSLNFKDGAVICNFYHKKTQSVIEAGRGSNASGNNIQGNGLKGTINVYDGAEFYNLGAQYGIFRLNGNAVMNMYGGTVRNCTTYDKEAIVAYIANGAAFNMSGGEIKNCTGTSSGNNSVVYLGMWGNSTFTMTGGTITSNTAKHSVFFGTTGSSKITIGSDAKIYGGSGSSNIYLANGRTITMHDTHLTEEADIWLYTATNPSDTADVKIATNAVKDDIAHIHSDNTVNAGVVYCDGETDWVYLNGVMTKLNNGAAHHTHTANTIWLSTAANDSNIEVNTTQAVTWNNWDGATIKTDRVAEGNTPSYDGETPTHAADAQYTYTFTGWTDGNGTFYAKDAELPAVTGDVTYTAVYNSTVNEYTVTWKNEDGSVIDTTQVAYGEVPTHADATKDADAQYTYTFAGWSDGSNTYAADALPAVSGDVTYTAVYNSTVNEYTVTWKNEDGSVIDTTQVAYGEVPTHDEPTKRYDRYYYYTFAGWDVEPVAVTGDAEYTATFEQNDIPLPNGPQDNGYYYFFGEKQKAYKLIRYYDEYWYLVSEYNRYAKNQIRYLEAYMVEGTGFEEGFYWFDSEGHMTTLRNGPQFDGYFYLNNERLNAYQLVEHEGEWYYIASGNKYARDTRCYLSSAIVAGTDIPAGYYDFDSEGRLIVKNGLYTDDCYYVDNVRQSAYQLVEIDGDYYYIAENHKIAKGQRRYLNAAVVENTPFAVGYYEFDDLGRMIFKNGPDADGYFYLNNEKQKAYKLIDFEGDYYFVAEYNKYAKNQRRYLNASMVEGTDFAVGYYNFDADGKMILAD